MGHFEVLNVDFIMPQSRQGLAADNAHRAIYQLRSHPRDYTARTCAHNQQVVMGLLYPNLVGVFFDSGGGLLQVIEKRLPFTASLNHVSGIPMLFEEGLQANVAEELHSWQNALGFSEDAVRLKPFQIIDRSIGIEDVPKSFRDLLANPDELNEEDRLELLDHVRRWNEEENYVFWWGEFYFVNRDGNVF